MIFSAHEWRGITQEAIQAIVGRRRSRGGPRTRCRNQVQDLAWEHVGIDREHLPEVAENCQAWVANLDVIIP